ncbi:MAG TPA: hypothetical protein VLE95_05165 [Chlamydiales bacterium]|nr:hypothetical protein [Chlamydiales bacterium]
MAAKQVESIKNGQKGVALANFKKNLSENYECFVLITCTRPTEDGKMEVEMDYEGDDTLAAFLIENAAQVFEAKQSLETN